LKAMEAGLFSLFVPDAFPFGYFSFVAFGLRFSLSHGLDPLTTPKAFLRESGSSRRFASPLFPVRFLKRIIEVTFQLNGN